MRLSALRVEGLRHTQMAQVDDLGPTDALPAAPSGTSLCDGLLLTIGALDHTRVEDVLTRLDLGTADEITADGPLADEVSGLDPDGVAALVDDLPVRRVIISASATLDPPLYRRLRERAVRDPKVLAALSTEAEVHLRVGWLFNQAGTHASPAPLAVRVGDVSFPLDAKERPPWLPELLHAIADRLQVLDTTLSPTRLASDYADAQLSSVPALRARFQLASELLSSPPFGLPQLAVVRRGARYEICFGPELVSLRLLGAVALHAVRWVHAAVIQNTDVLAADLRGDIDWLRSRIEGDSATLEQALLLEHP